ncbi:MAG TPA: hypothetical protein VIJ20_05615 [Solirubrobacteraceae bacterium]
MGQRARFHGIGLALAVGLTAMALAACGGSGAGTAGTSAAQLLKETFTGSHKMTSGTVDFELAVVPSGSSTLTSPITLSFAGPFQDFGKGKVGNSDFTLRVSALEENLLSLGLESVGGKGYVSLGSTSYPLPASEFRQLESRLSQTGSGSGSSSGILGKLGINPLRWLIDPKVSGSATVGGASTTHIRAGLNVGALIDDLGTFLAKASSLGVPDASKIPTSISPATRAKILAEVRRPSVDIWTGSTDRTLRRLALSLTLPVTGKISSELGGMKSAVLSLDIAYQDLNQPQSITAPTRVRPYRQFEAQVKELVTAIRGAVSSAVPQTSATGSSAGASSTGPGSYSECITSANGDYAKMYKCAGLIGGG